MNDLRIIVTVKNNVLLRVMEAEGFETAAALSRAAGVDQVTLGRYLNLKLAPLLPSGEWRPSAVRMANALRRVPEDLFPEKFLARALESNRVEREVSSDDLPALMGGTAPQSIAYDPERSLLVQDALAALDSALSDLRPRDQQAIKLYFGLSGEKPHTLEETAKRLNLTRERARQLILRGQRMLADPRRGLRQKVAPLLGGAA